MDIDYFKGKNIDSFLIKKRWTKSDTEGQVGMKTGKLRFDTGRKIFDLKKR